MTALEQRGDRPLGADPTPDRRWDASANHRLPALTAVELSNLIKIRLRVNVSRQNQLHKSSSLFMTTWLMTAACRRDRTDRCLPDERHTDLPSGVFLFIPVILSA
jgi:hypothetical protein